MSNTSLEETLNAAGYAKVIVALRPGTAAAAAAAENPVTAEAAIEAHFTVPNEGQMEGLAAVARRHASRSFRRAAPLEERRVRVYAHLGLAIGYVNRQGLQGLEADAQVSTVVKAPELSLIRPVDARAAQPAAGVSWGIRRIKAERLWAAGLTGQGAVIGHLDTGIDGTHPALRGAIKSFAEFDLAGDRVVGAQPTDSDSHGTHTAGTIAGRAVPGKGSFGVAPGAQLASGMVIEGGQVIDRILAGMDWVIDEGARVLSMSLGLRGYTDAFQVIVDALRTANVLPIIAVGNEGPMTSRSPGNYDNALSVGAMGENNRVADFSGSQRFARPNDPLVPDVVAPGVGVLSCVPGRDYEEMDGSSMATPHVAGLAALLLQAKSNATAEELEQAILGSCSRPAGMPAARGNRGVPDAVEAYRLLTGQPLPAAAAAAVASGPAPRARRGGRERMPVAAGAKARTKARTRTKPKTAAKPKTGRAGGTRAAAGKPARRGGTGRSAGKRRR